LLLPAEIELTPVARRRLAALKEFSDLGAGFKIAALDLELRGAGNLLGGEQSGHIEAVGFDLYTQMLEQAVREMKGEAEPQPQAQLNLGLNIRIPAGYVPEENQRLRLYKRIAGVETETQLADAESELRDRYGEPPLPVQQLLRYAALRLQAVQAGVTGIERKRDLVSVRFRQDAPIDAAKLAGFVSSQRGAQFLPDGTLKFPAKGLGARELLEQLQNLLENLFEQRSSPSVA
jgi:transcription-repair coupling factor (superfamily II helicase)